MIICHNIKISAVLALMIAFCNLTEVFADQADICAVPVTVSQLVQIDEKNSKIVVFNETHVMASKAISEYVLNSYLAHINAAETLGPDKWKNVFENCLKQEKRQLAANSLLLYILVAEQKNILNYDYLESVLITDRKSQDFSKQIILSSKFSVLTQKAKNIVTLSLALSDIYLLRAKILNKTLKLSDDFRGYAELELANSLKIKNVSLAKQIAATLEILYFSDAEKYRKIGLACNVIEELISNQSELSSSKLLPLISIRNTDNSLRQILDPFLVDGFHTLAKDAIQNAKYDEALSMVSSIDITQVTPTTYEIIISIIQSIDPLSRIFTNDTVDSALINASANSDLLKSELIKFYYKRTSALLQTYNVTLAQKSYLNFKQLSDDPTMEKELSILFASKLLQLGYKDEAAKFIIKLDLSIKDKLGMFIDGYYGNPIIYVLFVLIPLVVKLAYEFFIKVSKSVPLAQNESEEDFKTSGFANMQHEQPAHDHAQASNFVSSRMSRSKNPLFEEYNDCLSIFELEKSADLKTIKTAYRNAVRKIHPDLNANTQSLDDASRFVELTKAYDRLRELHRLLGLEEK